MKKIFLFPLLLWPLFGFAENPPQNPANEIPEHYSALPNLYDLSSVKKEHLSDKITRQYLIGSKSMFVKWDLKKGAVIPLHFHASEQITWITKGSVKVLSQGKAYTVSAGQLIIFPPYVPHEFRALEDTIDIDIFTPVRQDWLDNTASYLQKVQSK